MTFFERGGVKLFGYVSLMHLENWVAELKEHISQSDYAVLDGGRIYVEEWDIFVRNPGEQHYRETLYRKQRNILPIYKLDDVILIQQRMLRKRKDKNLAK